MAFCFDSISVGKNLTSNYQISHQTLLFQQEKGNCDNFVLWDLLSRLQRGTIIGIVEIRPEGNERNMLS